MSVLMNSDLGCIYRFREELWNLSKQDENNILPRGGERFF